MTLFNISFSRAWALPGFRQPTHHTTDYQVGDNGHHDSHHQGLQREIQFTAMDRHTTSKMMASTNTLPIDLTVATA